MRCALRVVSRPPRALVKSGPSWRPRVGEIRVDGLEGDLSHGHDPLLVALAEHTDRAVAAIHVRAVEAAALRDPDAGGVEQLQQRVVPAAARREPGGTVEELLGLVLREERRQAPGRPRAPDQPRRVLLDHAAPREEAQAAPDAGELSADAALGEPALMQRREVRAHAPHVDRRGSGVARAAEEGRELAQVPRIAANRVRRRPALHGQILEKGADGVVHHAPVTQRPSGAISCLYPHSSRMHARVTLPPRA